MLKTIQIIFIICSQPAAPLVFRTLWLYFDRRLISKLIYLFTMLCQFYIINTNNRYNNIHTQEYTDKAGYMLYSLSQLQQPLQTDMANFILLYTECQSSFIPVSYWLRTYHVIVEKFYCLPGNVAKRWSGWTLLLFTGK